MTTPVEFEQSCWPLVEGCVDTDDWDWVHDPEQAELWERSVALAERTLRRLTLHRVGGCPIKVRPIPQNGCQGVPLRSVGWEPHLQVDGSITNCGCNKVHFAGSIELTTYVGRVDEVKVNGVVVDPNHYVVFEHRYIVWRGVGPAPWGQQDLGRPDTEVGTYSVTYLPAREVDALGAIALTTLAMEFAKSCGERRGCRLPNTVRQVVRAGVTYQLDASGLFPGGTTGIDTIDRWIAIYNPNFSKATTRMWSPDMPRMVVEP